MPNVLVTPQVITKETLLFLTNRLGFAQVSDRKYEKDFVKIGDTLYLREANAFLTHTQRDITEYIQPIKERTREFTINKWTGFSFAIPADDQTLIIERLRTRYIEPGIKQMINDVEQAISQLGEEGAYWNVGTAGTPINAVSTVLAAQQKLLEAGAPDDGENYLFVSPADQASMANAMSSIYVTDIAKKAIVRGYVATIADFNIIMSQNVRHHTVGGTQTTVTVTTTINKNTSNLTVVKMTGLDSNLKKGDVFAIANVDAVNPRSKRSTGSLQQFVVTADTTASTGVSVPISPAIIMSDDITDRGAARQNVSAYPVAGAVITFENTNYMSNLGFHKSAIALATIPIQFEGAGLTKHSESHNGISVLVTKGSDFHTLEDRYRVDMMFGVTLQQDELIVKVKG